MSTPSVWGDDTDNVKRRRHENIDATPLISNLLSLHLLQTVRGVCSVKEGSEGKERREEGMGRRKNGNGRGTKERGRLRTRGGRGTTRGEMANERSEEISLSPEEEISFASNLKVRFKADQIWSTRCGIKSTYTLNATLQTTHIYQFLL